MALDFSATYKLLVLGDSNVGKTCIVHRYCDERYYDIYISTIGESNALFTCTFMGLCQTGDVVLVPQKHNNIRDLYFPLWMKSEKQWNIIVRRNHLIILCSVTSSSCFTVRENARA